MRTVIRKYRPSDRPHVIKFMEELQDYLASIDSMKGTRRMPDYGQSYTRRLFGKIMKNNGAAYVAACEGHIIGLIAGLVRTQSRDDLLECVPSKDGIVLELFVDAQFKRRRVGSLLTAKMEEYFRKRGCSLARVEVFEPNVNAHNLYLKLG